MGQNKIITIAIGMTLLCIAIPAFSQDSLQARLGRDIEDQSLDDFSRIEAAFILSGADQVDSLRQAIAWYRSLVETIENYHFDPFDRIGMASKIFSYLHSNWLITYREQATTLLDVIHKKEFNCVAGTILYNFVCSDLGLSTSAFETPTHVYTLFSDFGNNVMVENTSSMGFDIMNNLRAYSRYLAQFYPQEQVYEIGLDRLYAYENSNGREITNTELLGLLAYNRAYFANKNTDYGTAYNFVLLAQNFNRDSRSNVSFERDLYYQWGNVLYQQSRFVEAFEVYTKGYIRYPFNDDYAHNCEASFARAIFKNWQNKNWHSTKILVDKIMSLNILTVKTWDVLKNILNDWARYFEMTGNNESRLEVLQVLHKYFESE